MRRITAGTIGVGTEHVFTRQFAGKRIDSRNRYTKCEPGPFVEFAIPDGWLTGKASYLVEPRGDTSCVLTNRMAFELAGRLSVLEAVLKGILARDSRRDEAALRELLEVTKGSLMPTTAATALAVKRLEEGVQTINEDD